MKERIRPEPLTRAEDGTADPKSVADWSSSLPDSYIMCRDMGHTWRPFTVRFESEGNFYARVLRCGRCKTERVQNLGLSGTILHTNYAYPDGYPTPQGSGRITGTGRSALRLESTMRLIGKDERDG